MYRKYKEVKADKPNITKDVIDNFYPPYEQGSYKGVPEIRNFILALSEAVPDFKFHAVGSITRTTCDVYLERSPYYIGKLAWNKYENKYAVESRNITNNKYSTYNDDHHRVMTGSLKKAVKNAKTYLRAASTEDIMHINLQSARNKFSNTSNNARRDMIAAQSQVLGASIGVLKDHAELTLIQELKSLVKQGHVFNSATFAANFNTFCEKETELEQALAEETSPTFVYSHSPFGEHVFDVIQGGEYSSDSTPMVQYNKDTLPEYIIGKLAVLQIVEDDNYVEGVGYRVDGSKFYLQLNSEEVKKLRRESNVANN